MGTSAKRSTALVAALAAALALVLLAPSWTDNGAVDHGLHPGQDVLPDANQAGPSPTTLEEVALAAVPVKPRIEPGPAGPQEEPRRGPEPRTPPAPGTTLLPALTPRPAPLTLPRPGTVRIRGRLQWEEGEAPPDFTHARVRFFHADTDGNQFPLGDVAPTAQGTYTIDAGPSELAGSASREDFYVSLVVLVPGHEIVEDYVHFEGLSGKTIELEHKIERWGAVLTGRLIQGDGTPVVSASILWVDWSQSGRQIDTEEAYTHNDGTFEIHVGDGGWFVGVASHPSYGQAKFEFELPLHAGAHDFGDIVMPLGTVISGTVRGLGGEALPNVQMHLTPLDERHESAELSVMSDQAGRFQFGGVSDTAQRLHTDLSEDSLEVVPGTRGVEFRLRRPSAYVTVSDPTRNFRQLGNLLVRELDPATDKLMAREGNPQPNFLRSDGTFAVLLFDRPGRYSFGAYVDDDDNASWSAVRVLDIGLEHVKVPLRLAKENRSEVRFRVTGPNGDGIPEWTATIVDARTDMWMPKVDSRAPSLQMPAGEWTIHVVPGGGSCALPSSTRFSVPIEARGPNGTDAPTIVPITMSAMGGRVDVQIQVASEVRAKCGPALRPKLTIYNSQSKRVGRTAIWPLDGAPHTFDRALPAGRYRVLVECNDAGGFTHGRASGHFDVLAGQATKVALNVEARNPSPKPTAPH